MLRRRLVIVVSVIVVAVLITAIALRQLLLPGLSVARAEPSTLEVQIATWLLHASVPDAAKALPNPLGSKAEVADVTAGRELFRQKCEVCHAYDGGGKTEIGAGVFPRPPVLHAAATAMSDGEIFYHIRNGIRNTAMPAWNMSDRQIWQIVSYIRNLPGVNPVASPQGPVEQPGPTATAQYTGSEACKSCHEEVYARWVKTKMANVVRDPKLHPDAIIPDFSKPDKLLTFTKDDVALVYGSGWKQRYFTKIGDDYFPEPAQWDVTHKIWRPYMVANGADWWVPFYPTDNFMRPTGPLCDGCHSVNYNIETKTVTEWNVGCERCHGAGSEHVKQPTRANILNPGRMDYVAANDTCIQCHSQGRPPRNPIKGKYYDWPVGYNVGLKLSDYWNLEEHKIGDLTFTHFPDGTAHKNRMQGNDFVQSLMYARGVTCFSCHDPHGSENEAILRKPVNDVCLTCHGPNTQNGPHAASIEAHTHHKRGSTGSQCVSCHMPKIEQTIADVNVSSHTFHFVTPTQTEIAKIPNACNVCHTDKDTAWAKTAIKSWSDRSPWRMFQ
ncbi:MAG TPA: c-type cytochrome [Micropepsaceae bacterium]|nr:c-type cytochrome [Micropepsaceae bacterium]